MKKILFLLLICVIKLSAYEYLVGERTYNLQSDYTRYVFFLDENNECKLKIVRVNGAISYANEDASYNIFSYIKFGGISTGGIEFISKSEYDEIYKSDLNFLNGLYSDFPNSFFNYLYNDSLFDNSNYIIYENYDILYNSDGLAVESIVDGVWAGLYDDSQKTRSGALYDSTGSLKYYNGKAVDPVTSFLLWLQSFIRRVVLDAFMEIKRSVVTGIIMTVVLTLALVRFVLLFLPSVISKSHYGGRSFRSEGYGGGSLPDFGDGRAVAASVRERLAAKNRRLKSQSDRSGVTQSMENSILFDLEEK